jgi:hypothetical protein
MCPFFKFTTKYFMLLQAAKYIGAGLATIGLAGAGVGIGTGARWRCYFFAYKSIKSLRKNRSDLYFKQFDTALLFLTLAYDNCKKTI